MENGNLRPEKFISDSKNIYDKLEVFPIIVSPQSRNKNLMIRPMKTALPKASENTEATTMDLAGKLLKDRNNNPKRFLKEKTVIQFDSHREQTFNPVHPHLKIKEQIKPINHPSNLTLNTPANLQGKPNLNFTSNQKDALKNSSGVLLNVSYYDDILEKYRNLNKLGRKKFPLKVNTLQAKLNFRIKEIRMKEEENQQAASRRRRLKLIEPNNNIKKDLTSLGSNHNLSPDQVINGNEEPNLFDLINHIDKKENHHVTHHNYETSKNLQRINSVCTKDFKYTKADEPNDNSLIQVEKKQADVNNKDHEISSIKSFHDNNHKKKEQVNVLVENINNKKHHASNSSSFIILSSSSGQQTKQVKFTYKKKKMLCCF